MFGLAVNLVLIIAYMGIGVGLGATAYYMYDYSIVISGCLGGMFMLGCGLLHVGLSPRKAKPVSYTHLDVYKRQALVRSKVFRQSHLLWC